MNKLMPILLGGVILFGAAACDEAKTSDEPSYSIDQNDEELVTLRSEGNQGDAMVQETRKEIEVNFGTTQEPNQALGNLENLDEDDQLASLVLNNLETKLPNTQLEVEAAEGMVTISGKVSSDDQLSQIAPLAIQVEGVQSVDVQATVKEPNS
ncbi:MULTISPECIES: BON domain-containing protein [unclassified Moorena]|uniref:BON domain-containing protein n=1 Tax=unclassified Moorena TaxID=2683338 RepID=UPI0013CB41D5|nr:MULTISPECIES: BON domain-containing protein [unclassified Moorena]NEO23598.1 BON domain-containing protein [Moorena sp. SIO4A5]NEQ57993.1 BON domain-containing protein [Moorena sp. SIO4A1]